MTHETEVGHKEREVASGTEDKSSVPLAAIRLTPLSDSIQPRAEDRYACSPDLIEHLSTPRQVDGALSGRTSQHCGAVVSEAVKALSCLVKREASKSTTVRRCSTEDKALHAGIRTYSGEGAKEFFDRLEKRKSDVESLIRSVKEFVSYSLVRTSDGGISVTVCQDNASAEESL